MNKQGIIDKYGKNKAELRNKIILLQQKLRKDKNIEDKKELESLQKEWQRLFGYSNESTILEKINSYLNEENFTKENEVVKHVQDNARHKMVMGKSYYHVYVNGKSYHSDDTRQLVLDICKDLKIDAK